MKRTIISVLMMLFTFMAQAQPEDGSILLKGGSDLNLKFAPKLKIDFSSIADATFQSAQSAQSKLKSTLANQEFRDSIKGYSWNNTVNQWQESFKIEYTYDNEGNMTQQLITIFSWYYSDLKHEYTYNAEGKKTQHIYYGWSNANSLWKKISKDEYTYDADGNQTQEISYNWNDSTSQWEKSSKNEYTYDADSNKTQEISYNWDDTGSLWGKRSKLEYTYDADGNRAQEISYNWNDTASLWKEDNKTEYTYNTDDKLTLNISYNWDDTASMWKEDNKTEYTNTDGQLTKSISYNWNDTASMWKENNKTEYTHNTDGQLKQDISYNWNDSTDLWQKKYKHDYYYSELLNSINDRTSQISKVYPNPASHYLFVDLLRPYKEALLELISLRGNKVISINVKNHETISLKSIDPGLYMYNLYSNEKKRQSGKLIITK